MDRTQFVSQTQYKNRGRGVMKGQHKFAEIPSANIQRSRFNRSCNLKTTFEAGYLIPIFLDEALPGDTMNMRMSTFCRMATPIYPVMDNFYLDYFFFAVPNRLVWDNWVKMNGEQVDPDDSTDYTVPTMDAPVGGHAEGSLSDYFGIPIDVEITHSSLFHRAYALIYNEWFRDENLIDSVTVDTDDGPDTSTDYELLKRGKRHDYFTSCLPWPQKGDAVDLPLGTSAPLQGAFGSGGVPTFDIDDLTATKLEGTAVASGVNVVHTASASSSTGDVTWNSPNLNLTGVTADLSSATAATINELRQAFQIQRLFERDARGGTRYTEILRSHFGVISPDQRLQRPEYLGGGTQVINVHPVAGTAEVGSLHTGDLGAFVTSASNGSGFTKSFTEHCMIIGIACVRADLNYQQGLERMFSRSTRFDFYWPALAHLGEQQVLNQEIYADGSANDALTFGYQERYAEYRYKPSKITGAMRSTAATPLDAWHLAQEFESLPVLDQTFIEEDPPFDRVIATPSEPSFLFDAYFDYQCARPMPTYSVPGLIDHF